MCSEVIIVLVTFVVIFVQIHWKSILELFLLDLVLRLTAGLNVCRNVNRAQIPNGVSAECDHLGLICGNQVTGISCLAMPYSSLISLIPSLQEA